MDRLQSRNYPTFLLSMPIQGLQLSKNCVKHLNKRGINTVAQLLNLGSANKKFKSEIALKLDLLDKCCDDHDFDIVKFWRSVGSNIFLCARSNSLRQIKQIYGPAKVSRVTFGNAGAMIARAGVETLEELIDRLENNLDDIFGMGPGKIDDLYKRLSDLIATLDGDVAQQESQKKFLNLDTRITETLPGALKSLDIGWLRISTKTNYFRGAGLNNIGDFYNFIRNHYSNDRRIKIAGVGASTLNEAKSVFYALQDATTSEGDLDFQQYALQNDLILIGGKSTTLSVDQFLFHLDELWEQLINAFDDAMDKAIIQLRLSKQGDDRVTLEELANLSNPPITRERVRQRENKLLKKIVLGLIFDEYGNERFIFNPLFSNFWKALANSITGDEIEIRTFLETTSEIWEIPVDRIISRLPIILQLVTGEALNHSANLISEYFEPKILYNTNEETNNIHSASVLRKKDLRLAQRFGDVKILGNLINIVKQSFVDRALNDQEIRLLKSIASLAKSLGPDGDFQWATFAEQTGKKLILNDSLSMTAFFENLENDIITVVDHVQLRAKGHQIFKERTIVDRDIRKTVATLSKELGVQQPVITMMERHSINRLQEVLFERNFHYCNAIISPLYLEYWSTLADVYNRTGSEIVRFKSELVNCYGISPKLITNNLYIIVPLLTGYSHRRLSRYTSHSYDQIETDKPRIDLSAKIKLRGFRRLH